MSSRAKLGGGWPLLALSFASSLASGCRTSFLEERPPDATELDVELAWIVDLARRIDLADPPTPLDLAVPATPGDLLVRDGMVRVPEGDFMMGCNGAIDTQCADCEKPYHRVHLAAFEIDQMEVTQAAWQRCVAAGACERPDFGFDPVGTPTWPVIHVNFAGARGYCAWAGKRLPSEAEWEKAARGTDGRIYPWGNSPPDCRRANVYQCGNELEPVGSHPDGASPYGVLDMAGNAAEIVQDWFAADYYQVSPLEQPTGPPSGFSEVLRGGDYINRPPDVRASARLVPIHALGVRCAR